MKTITQEFSMDTSKELDAMKGCTVASDTLMKIMIPELGTVRSVQFNGIVYYLVCDVCEVLNICNTTKVIGTLSGSTIYNAAFVKTHIKKYVERFNQYRAVHLVTIEGVYQIIFNNKSTICNEIKDYLSIHILPKCINTMGVKI